MRLAKRALNGALERIVLPRRLNGVPHAQNGSQRFFCEKRI